MQHYPMKSHSRIARSPYDLKMVHIFTKNLMNNWFGTKKCSRFKMRFGRTYRTVDPPFLSATRRTTQGCYIYHQFVMQSRLVLKIFEFLLEYHICFLYHILYHIFILNSRGITPNGRVAQA